MNTSNNKVKEFFDELAPNWDKQQNTNDDFVLSLLNKIGIKKNQDILDLACGTGTITKKLFDLTNKKVTAIDISPEMLKIAKAKYSEDVAEFLTLDFYDYEGKKFDWIIIFNSYPHFLDLEKLKKKLLNSLKDEGHVAIIHSQGREELDSHHKAHALKVSRFLKPVEEEASFYKDVFDVEIGEEDSNHYLIVLKKKR